jgi:hypothetical protein
VFESGSWNNTVHYGGYPSDMDRLAEIAKRHNLFIIEDYAHTDAIINAVAKVKENVGELKHDNYYSEANWQAGQCFISRLYLSSFL